MISCKGEILPGPVISVLEQAFSIFEVNVCGKTNSCNKDSPFYMLVFLVFREWLHQLSQGVDYEPVRPRQLPKSFGCGKNFPGKGKLATTDQVQDCSRLLHDGIPLFTACRWVPGGMVVGSNPSQIKTHGSNITGDKVLPL